MSNATIERIREAAQKRSIEDRVSAPSHLLPILFELYPEEILAAAAPQVIKNEVYEKLYLFGINAQLANALIEPQQLKGITLTHGKITQWLKTTGAKSFVDLDNKSILKAYLEFHEKQIAQSMEAIKIITNELTKE